MYEIRVNYTFITPFCERYEFMQDYVTVENETEFKKLISDAFKKRKDIRDISLSVIVPGNSQCVVIEQSYFDENVFKVTTFDNELSMTKNKLASFVLWYVDQQKSAA